MNKIETFQEFLTTQSPTVPIFNFVFNLLLAALLGYILKRIYIKYGDALSNREMFGSNFILLTSTTMIIITIVKSSLALSLGLVGALSIVRFRAAIKEPEELSYLFLAIAVGLGLGADQTILTLTGFIILVSIIILKGIKNKDTSNNNVILTITSIGKQKIELESIIKILRSYCSRVSLKRVEDATEILEASFIIEFDNFDKFNKSKNEIQKLDSSINIKLLDNQGIL